MTDKKITKRMKSNNDISDIEEKNESQKVSKAFYKTKKFQNFIYKFVICLSLILTLSYFIPLAEACTCGNEKDTWTYKEFMKSGFKEIFDKMGFFCRNIGWFCCGKQYNALNANEKKAIDIWSKEGKYRDYFSFLPDNIIEYFCNIVYPYETKECELQNILKCALPDKTIEFSPPYINYFEYMNFLSEYNRAK